MNPVIFRLTVRQVLSRKRTLLMLLFAAVPVLVALAFNLAGETGEEQDFTANGVEGGLILVIILPFTALVFGTAVLGAEIQDGTLVYILSKPEPRWRILLTKLAVAFLTTAVLVAATATISGVIALRGAPNDGIVQGFVVAGVYGSLVYCCLFVLLSVWTSRALIAGLVYVFAWEGLVSGIFRGTRTFSVRESSLALADAFTSVPEFEANIDAMPAVVVVLGIAVVATVLAVRKLRRFEVGEAG